ncbi:MAG: YceI family protein [Blastocatellia bacterium]|nr:YceI family protein [Blastocatellia bacterium]
MKYPATMPGIPNQKVRFKLMPEVSHFTVQAFPEGWLASWGHSPTIEILNFTGAGWFVAETLAEAGMEVWVRTDSLRVLDDIKDKDRQEIERMALEVLEVTTYPVVHFQSTALTLTKMLPSLYQARIIGDLTWHGVKRPNLSILAQVQFAGDTILAQGDFNLRQTDFQIKPVSFAAGALRLMDELTFRFELVGEIME